MESRRESETNHVTQDSTRGHAVSGHSSAWQVAALQDNANTISRTVQYNTSSYGGPATFDSTFVQHVSYTTPYSGAGYCYNTLNWGNGTTAYGGGGVVSNTFVNCTVHNLGLDGDVQGNVKNNYINCTVNNVPSGYVHNVNNSPRTAGSCDTYNSSGVAASGDTGKSYGTAVSCDTVKSYGTATNGDRVKSCGTTAGGDTSINTVAKKTKGAKNSSRGVGPAQRSGSLRIDAAERAHDRIKERSQRELSKLLEKSKRKKSQAANKRRQSRVESVGATQSEDEEESDSSHINASLTSSSVTTPGYSSSVTTPGYSSSMTTPGYSSSMTTPGYSSSMTTPGYSSFISGAVVVNNYSNGPAFMVNSVGNPWQVQTNYITCNYGLGGQWQVQTNYITSNYGLSGPVVVNNTGSDPAIVVNYVSPGHQGINYITGNHGSQI